ncbi:MAG: efflux RND transporter periplasmic adaptor subunit [Candidatus Eremiobacteraeota bacterium]|nr:efflux RND transporter periplasmic adaptor subunit [Candidatus Eremiobacteraeota bacterium]MCW5868928.1 efflux RND transporter periplasmic adaptor subunit [Candidatus Eremiobacteraeota bacterium]
MKRLIPFVLLLVALAVWWSQRPPAARTALTYSGVVEATTVDCAFEMAGTVSEVLVQEGQSVRKGEVLARLDRRSWQASVEQMRARASQARFRYQELERGYRPAEIAQASSRLRAAQAELQQLESGATAQELQAARAQMLSAAARSSMLNEGYRREEIDSARSQLASARTNLQLTQLDYQRFQRLHKEGAISDQQLEARKNQWAQARSSFEVASAGYARLSSGPRRQERSGAYEDYQAAAARYHDLADGTRPELIEKARAQVAERRQALDLMRQGPRREEIEAARAGWKEARASLQAAEVQLSKASLLAPLDAVISVRNLEPGESVTAGTSVLTLADLKHPWVNLYIPEYERSQVALGAVGKISGDGVPAGLSGKVTRIYDKAEFTPKFIQTPRERVNLVYRAKLLFDNPDLVMHPGQPVDVRL